MSANSSRCTSAPRMKNAKPDGNGTSTRAVVRIAPPRPPHAPSRAGRRGRYRRRRPRARRARDDARLESAVRAPASLRNQPPCVPSAPRDRSWARAGSSLRRHQPYVGLKRQCHSTRRNSGSTPAVGSECGIGEPGSERSAEPHLTHPAIRPGTRGFGNVRSAGLRRGPYAKRAGWSSQRWRSRPTQAAESPLRSRQERDRRTRSSVGRDEISGVEEGPLPRAKSLDGLLRDGPGRFHPCRKASCDKLMELLPWTT